jgi:hypothetical protein
MPVEEPHHDVAEVAEYDAAGATTVFGLGNRRPAAGQDDQTVTAKNLATGGRRRGIEDEQRAGVAFDVRPAEVQERGAEDVRQASGIPSRMPCPRTGAAIGPVQDLQDQMTARKATMTNSALRASASTVSASPVPISHLRLDTGRPPPGPGPGPGLLLIMNPRS